MGGLDVADCCGHDVVQLVQHYLLHAADLAADVVAFVDVAHVALDADQGVALDVDQDVVPDAVHSVALDVDQNVVLDAVHSAALDETLEQLLQSIDLVHLIVHVVLCAYCDFYSCCYCCVEFSLLSQLAFRAHAVLVFEQLSEIDKHWFQ